MRTRTLLSSAMMLLLLGGCTEAQFQDVETQWVPADANEDLVTSFGNPDAIHVLRNINMHPNLAVVCFEGVAIMTHTRDDRPVRVPEWDRLCPEGDGRITPDGEPGAAPDDLGGGG